MAKSCLSLSVYRFLNRLVVLLALPFLACVPDSPSRTIESGIRERRPGSHPSTYISGHVVDSSGDPIPEFEYLVRGGAVKANERGPNGMLLEPKRISHPQGEFRAEYYEGHGKRQTIVVGAPRYVTRYYVFEPGPLDSLTDIRIALDKAVLVKGTVTDAKGRGVPGASIWVGPVPVPGHHGRPGPVVETDKRGRFYSDRLPAGTTTLGVLHPDHPATSFEVSLSLSGTNQPVLELPSGVTLSGTMSFGEAPVHDGLVLAERKTEDKFAKPTNDVFLLKGVPSDVTNVSFQAFRPESTGHKSSWYLRKHVDLADREELRFDVRFPVGTATLAGELLIEGKPIGSKYGGSLYATPHGQPLGLQISADANEQGKYIISDMPEGDWDVQVHLYDEELGGFDSRRFVTTRAGNVTRFTVDFPLNDD